MFVPILRTAFHASLLKAIALGFPMALARGPAESVSILNPELYSQVVERREVVTRVSRKQEKSGLKYLVSSKFHVRAALDKVKKALTDYGALKTISPYLQRVEFRTAENILILEGEILKYKLGAALGIEQKSPTWFHYTSLVGPSEGLPADLYLEPHGKGETLVYLDAAFKIESRWVPAYAVEKASQLLLLTAAQKLRSRFE